MLDRWLVRRVTKDQKERHLIHGHGAEHDARHTLYTGGGGNLSPGLLVNRAVGHVAGILLSRHQIDVRAAHHFVERHDESVGDAAQHHD